MTIKAAYNRRIGKSWADGSCVASFVKLFSSGSGRTSNSEPNINHPLLILFSTSVGQAGRKTISQPSPILGRWQQTKAIFINEHIYNQTLFYNITFTNWD